MEKKLFDIFMQTFWPSASSAWINGVCGVMTIPHSWDRTNDDEDQDDGLAIS